MKRGAVFGGFASELRKLRRPAFLWVTLVAIVLAVIIAAFSQQSQRTYLFNLRDGERQFLATPPAPADLGLKPGPAYRRAIAEQQQSLHRQVVEATAQAELVGATQHPAGALGFVARLLASSLGFFVVCLLAGLHVGGEWEQGSVKDVLIREPSRLRFVALKTLSLWAASGAILLLAWLGVALFGLLSQHLWPLPQPPSTAAVWLWGGRQLLRALPVLLLFVTTGVSLAVLLRSVLAPVVGGVVLAATGFFLSQFDLVWGWVFPSSWIAEIMQYDTNRAPVNFLLDHPLTASRVTAMPWGVALGAVVLLSALLFAGTAKRMGARRDSVV